MIFFYSLYFLLLFYTFVIGNNKSSSHLETKYMQENWVEKRGIKDRVFCKLFFLI